MKWCPHRSLLYNVPFAEDGNPVYSPPRDHPYWKEELKRSSVLRRIHVYNQIRRQAAAESTGLPLPAKDCFLCESLIMAVQSFANTREKNGGSSGQGFYGTIVTNDIDRIFQIVLVYQLITAPEVVLVDIGCGFGRPLLHGAFLYGFKTYGCDIDKAKIESAVANGKEMKAAKPSSGLHSAVAAAYKMNQDRMIKPVVEIKDATKYVLPTDTNMVYMFWKGYHTNTKRDIAKLMYECETLQVIVIVGDGRVRDTEETMKELGCPGLAKITSFVVSGHGMGEKHNAVIFKKGIVDAEGKVSKDYMNRIETIAKEIKEDLLEC